MNTLIFILFLFLTILTGCAAKAPEQQLPGIEWLPSTTCSPTAALTKLTKYDTPREARLSLDCTNIVDLIESIRTTAPVALNTLETTRKNAKDNTLAQTVEANEALIELQDYHNIVGQVGRVVSATVKSYKSTCATTFRKVNSNVGMGRPPVIHDVTQLMALLPLMKKVGVTTQYLEGNFDPRTGFAYLNHSGLAVAAFSVKAKTTTTTTTTVPPTGVAESLLASLTLSPAEKAKLKMDECLANMAAGSLSYLLLNLEASVGCAGDDSTKRLSLCILDDNEMISTTDQKAEFLDTLDSAIRACKEAVRWSADFFDFLGSMPQSPTVPEGYTTMKFEAPLLWQEVLDSLRLLSTSVKVMYLSEEFTARLEALVEDVAAMTRTQWDTMTTEEGIAWKLDEREGTVLRNSLGLPAAQVLDRIVSVSFDKVRTGNALAVQVLFQTNQPMYTNVYEIVPFPVDGELVADRYLITTPDQTAFTINAQPDIHACAMDGDVVTTTCHVRLVGRRNFDCGASLVRGGTIAGCQTRTLVSPYAFPNAVCNVDRPKDLAVASPVEGEATVRCNKLSSGLNYKLAKGVTILRNAIECQVTALGSLVWIGESAQVVAPVATNDQDWVDTDTNVVNNGDNGMPGFNWLVDSVGNSWAIVIIIGFSIMLSVLIWKCGIPCGLSLYIKCCKCVIPQHAQRLLDIRERRKRNGREATSFGRTRTSRHPAPPSTVQTEEIDLLEMPDSISMGRPVYNTARWGAEGRQGRPRSTSTIRKGETKRRAPQAPAIRYVPAGQGEGVFWQPGRVVLPPSRSSRRFEDLDDGASFAELD